MFLTDGVGTKIDLANKFKMIQSGSIWFMCVNDLVVQGASRFFLDYIAVES